MGAADHHEGAQAAGGSRPADPNPMDRLPRELRDVLTRLQPVLPEGVYLAGGTALALRLGHRVSRDLDFFFHGDGVDLDRLAADLGDLGGAVELRGSGTLRGLLAAIKVEFFQVDLLAEQQRLETPELIAGVPVAGLKDLMATKLKVLAERGELRDYYDVKCIDEHGEVSLEDGVALFLMRYGLSRASDALPHLVRALGYLDDVADDESLPTSKTELAAWWRIRQAKLLRNLATR